jgi:putative chitobiose transport system permease protein
MKRSLAVIANYVLLILVTIISVAPFIWMLSTAFKGPGDDIFAFPPRFIPSDPRPGNFAAVFKAIPLARYFLNSFIIVGVSIALNVALSLLAAYPLARMKFRGSRFIFIAILSTMMIPTQLVMIPNFVLTVQLGLKNNYLGVILPGAVTAFGIFLMRQALLAIPSSLEEAAWIDGAGPGRILFSVLMPLVKPTTAALAVFTFVGTWGDFLWPLLVIDKDSMLTVPLGVQKLQGTFMNDWRLISAGTILSMVPILIFFCFTQRYFIEGAMTGSVKE